MKGLRLQFTLSDLFVATLSVAVVIGMFIQFGPEREYPYLRFQKRQSEVSRNGEFSQYYRIKVDFDDCHGMAWTEQYLGTMPLGDSPGSASILLSDSSRVDETAPGGGLRPTPGGISPVVKARFRQIVGFIENEVDVETWPVDRMLRVLLPADFPTFEEFEAEWKKNHPGSAAADNTVAGPTTE